MATSHPGDPGHLRRHLGEPLRLAGPDRPGRRAVVGPDRGPRPKGAMTIALIVSATLAAVGSILGIVAGLISWALYRRLHPKPDPRPEVYRGPRTQGGWQKPVSPPAASNMPRGLPPR